MGFTFSEAHRESYRTLGYTVFRGIIPPTVTTIPAGSAAKLTQVKEAMLGKWTGFNLESLYALLNSRMFLALLVVFLLMVALFENWTFGSVGAESAAELEPSNTIVPVAASVPATVSEPPIVSTPPPTFSEPVELTTTLKFASNAPEDAFKVPSTVSVPLTVSPDADVVAVAPCSMTRSWNVPVPAMLWAPEPSSTTSPATGA